jgi:Zn-finger nucleic acid-binding protein/ribosomal protein L32
MADAPGVLRCPSCGAPAAPDTRVCPYCSTPLALVACPSCFAKIFRGARFCPYCGAEATRAEAAPRPARPCPECQQPLSAVKVGSVILDECRRCGGLWVDSAAFERICAESEEQTVVLQTRFAAPETPLDPHRRQGYWPCPECRRLMNRQNFARVSGVVVDVCRGHGVWFNEGELRRIVEFIRGGGMERARAREKEDLQEERERLRQAELDARLSAARVPPAYHVPSSGRSDYVDILSAVSGLLNWIK